MNVLDACATLALKRLRPWICPMREQEREGVGRGCEELGR